MGKRDRQKSKIRQPNSLPLFVVCGLPPATAVHAELAISKAFSNVCKVIAPPSPTSDYRIYNKNYIEEVINQMTGFASRRRQSEDESPTPAGIIVFFVNSGDAEDFISLLDFAVFPVALPHLANWDEKGQMRRHSDTDTVAAITLAVETVKRSSEHFNRIKLRRPNDAIMLPPSNYFVRRNALMSELFLEMRQGQRSIDNRFPELVAIEYTAEKLPKLKDRRARFFKDAREIVFVQPHESAFHGGAWDTEPNSEMDKKLLVLKELYRFGGALPQGFQHDAQYEDGEHLKDVDFDCSICGSIKVSDDHADIYANDYVRHRTKK
ncbi:hypothetical protein [Sinorhizobium fredii]|uniref:hypothetical protein n=1 Tax=Rhizobium fredii TaxID=380 RepID=UPI00056CFDF3|nr:hypothetical protein [Sinorhizobium fredii]